MDSELRLRIQTDKGVKVDVDEELNQLSQSPLVKQLTQDLIDKSLFYVWRVIALSEIPYAHHLEYTQRLIDRVFDRLSTPYGFSLSGDEKQFLPCYNAMLVSALCRLGLADSTCVRNAVAWIIQYQPMSRGIEVNHPKLRFDRYGGCFKNTPCYIGLAKSVMALQAYSEATGNMEVEPKLAEGIEYMLEHQLFKRLSADEPITKHITDIAFPESYHLNIVELIRFAAKANLLNDSRTEALIELLQKRKGKGGWKVSYRYKAEGFHVFDKGRQPGDWVTHIIEHALNGRQS